MAGRKPISGLPPIAGLKTRVLVLGSMPGSASLAAGRYYAHPRNQFWPILGEILGFDPGVSYSLRTRVLARARIALWDVVAHCVRPGSLDSAIEDDSIVANDFAAFLAAHTRIARICFNGRKAEAAWHRHVRGALPPVRELEYFLLPSTSPAHAGMGYREKLRIWRNALAC